MITGQFAGGSPLSKLQTLPKASDVVFSLHHTNQGLDNVSNELPTIIFWLVLMYEKCRIVLRRRGEGEG
jgi:hypothetical protein